MYKMMSEYYKSFIYMVNAKYIFRFGYLTALIKIENLI